MSDTDSRLGAGLSSTTAAVLSRVIDMLKDGYSGDIVLRCSAGKIAKVGVDGMPATAFAQDERFERCS